MITVKSNLNIQELVKALREQNLMKNDFVVSSNRLQYRNGKLIVSNGDSEDLAAILQGTGISAGKELELQILEHCHNQFSDKLDIGKKYYSRLLAEESPALLDTNANYWLAKANTNYYLRTFVDRSESKGYARAVLSDRYFTLDNYDVMLSVMDAIKDSGLNLQIESADITDTNFFMRVIAPDVEIQAPELLKNYRVPKGSPDNGNTGIISGFVISNSEVGAGKFCIKPRAVVLACKNGMTRNDESFNRIHLGGKMDENSAVVWSEETRRKNMELVCSQVKDAIKTFATVEYLNGWMNKLKEFNAEAGEVKHTTDIIKNVSKEYSFSKEKEDSILSYFIKGADLTPFGVAQALTYYAHQDAQPEERYELEEVSTDVMVNYKKYDRNFEKVKRGPKPKVNPSLN